MIEDNELKAILAELKQLREANQRFEAVFVRIAKAHGIDSPLILIAMAENDEENYAEILARYIEKTMVAA